MHTLLLKCGGGIWTAPTPRWQLLWIVLVGSAKEIIWQTDSQQLNHITLFEKFVFGESSNVSKLFMRLMKFLKELQHEASLPIDFLGIKVASSALLLLRQLRLINDA